MELQSSQILIKNSFLEPLFSHTKNPPKSLNYIGNFNQKILKNCLAIVGSRKNTNYGRSIIEKFMPYFVSQNITIISGFMYGIDSLAHQSCLDCGGHTIAVVANGLNIIYPSRNQKLFKDIINQNGAIVTEYDHDFKPTLWSFPQRNRIVASLANLGVLVIEAGQNSGSLITAHLANEIGRPVYAIPGSIDTISSQGTNWLIKTGRAKMVTEITDILPVKVSKQQNIFDPSDSKQSQILELLSREPLSIDQISQKLSLPISETTSILTLMSMDNLVEDLNGIFFKK